MFNYLYRLMAITILCLCIAACGSNEIPAADSYLMPAKELELIHDVEVVESILDADAEKDAYRPKLQYALQYRGMQQAKRAWYDTLCSPNSRTLCNITVDILVFDSNKNALRAIEHRYENPDAVAVKELPGLAKKAFKQGETNYAAVNDQILITITARSQNINLDAFAKHYLGWFSQQTAKLELTGER